MQKAKVWLRQNKFLAGMLLLVVLYLATRLINLTLLPVFADEAIYIYWAQLASSDWSRFLFYPLNDGKTPLFIWSLIPVLEVSPDALLAGRLVAVAFGLGELWLVTKTTALFTKRKIWPLFSGALLVLAPGFMLNQRLALMDSMLTFFLTASWYLAYRGLAQITPEKSQNSPAAKSILAAGACFGAALLTKFSAILMLPVLAAALFFFVPGTFWRGKMEKKDWWLLLRRGLSLAAIAVIGLAMLYALKVSPAFSQLFARGGDFLYTLPEFLAHPGEIIARNAQFFAQVLSNYLTSVLAVGAVALAIYVWPRERRALALLACGACFLLPILALGKVMYSRYLLPVLPFCLVSFCVSLAALRKKWERWLAAGLLVLIVLLGGGFLWTADLAPERMPLLPGDRVQFFDEWSAGYGIKETVALVKALAQEEKTLVLTEGHIGTLPDGLQIYLFADEARNNLRIEGIGQPVKEKNLAEIQEVIAEYPQVVLVVNSHRLELNLSPDQLMADYPRPNPEAPSLQVWRIK